MSPAKRHAAVYEPLILKRQKLENNGKAQDDEKIVFPESPVAFGKFSLGDGEGFSPALQLSPLKVDAGINFSSRKTTSFDSYYESL